MCDNFTSRNEKSKNSEQKMIKKIFNIFVHFIPFRQKSYIFRIIHWVILLRNFLQYDLTENVPFCTYKEISFWQ